jgi:hypothetical protein
MCELQDRFLHPRPRLGSVAIMTKCDLRVTVNTLPVAIIGEGNSKNEWILVSAVVFARHNEQVLAARDIGRLPPAYAFNNSELPKLGNGYRIAWHFWHIIQVLSLVFGNGTSCVGSLIFISAGVGCLCNWLMSPRRISLPGDSPPAPFLLEARVGLLVLYLFWLKLMCVEKSERDSSNKLYEKPSVLTQVFDTDMACPNIRRKGFSKWKIRNPTGVKLRETAQTNSCFWHKTETIYTGLLWY